MLSGLSALAEMVLSAVVILAVATGLVNADPENVLLFAVVRLAVATGLTDALADTVLSAVVSAPDTVAPLAASAGPAPNRTVPNADFANAIYTAGQPALKS